MPVEGGASGAAKPGADKSAAAPTPSAQEKEKVWMFRNIKNVMITCTKLYVYNPDKLAS